MRGGMIQCAVDIARSPEDVFDYVTDISREFEWNPRTRRVVKLTDGRVGAGTRREGEWVAGDPMLIDHVAFDCPTSWRSVGRSRDLMVVSEGRVEVVGTGSPLTVRMELEPHGRLRLLAPLIGRIMRGGERRNVVAIKARLDSRAAAANGGEQQ